MVIRILISIRVILETLIRIQIPIRIASSKNLDPDLHPDPQQSKLDPESDPDLHQFADYKPKCMEYESI